jgi:RHH-type proline utilization regulon transcriptional repressor/proline dehydrogenase/delta 1-pyrroline-5-carboxylate dehydrogenase
VQSYLPADVAGLVKVAESHADEWKHRAVAERVAVMRKAASLMREQRWELAAWEVFEEAKPWREADADVAEAVDFLEYYAGEMEQLDPPPRLGRYPGELNELFWSPRGVTVVIAPWNFPLAIPAGMVAAALVSGNPVLFKPSERASIMGYRLATILRQAGVPAGVLQYVPGGPDVGRELVTQASVATIAFTGSKDVGLGMVQAAAVQQPGQKFVKRVIAEMGGKNAIIVDDTADLDEAVTGVVQSCTGYAGQKCSACSRVILLDSIHDAFIQRLADAVMSLRIGAAEDPATQLGPVIDGRAQKRIRDYLEIGRREGRVVVDRSMEGPRSCRGTGGHRRDRADSPAGTGRNFRPRAGRDAGFIVRTGAPARQRHRLRIDRGTLLAQSPAYRTGASGVRCRQPLHQPFDYRRPGRSATVRRPPAIGYRGEGRGRRVPETIHGRACRQRADAPARIRSDPVVRARILR